MFQLSSKLQFNACYQKMFLAFAVLTLAFACVASSQVLAQAEPMSAGTSSVAEEQRKAKERAKAKQAAEQAAAEAKRKEEAAKNPQNLKVVKMQPKVHTKARTFVTTPCRSLGEIKPGSAAEERNLKQRKKQCVKSAAAFEKGYQ